MSHISDLLDTSLELIFESQGIGLERSTRSGFQDLDALTGGFRAGEVTVIAGRPSMGLTALSLNIALSVASRYKERLSYLSLSCSKELIGRRLLCLSAEVDVNQLRFQTLTSSDWADLRQTKTSLSSLPLFLIDYREFSNGINAEEIEKTIASVADHRLLVLDSLDFIDPAQHSSTLIELSKLARRLNVAIIVLSSIPKGVDERANNRPVLSDFSHSGLIDNLWFLYREAYYNPEVENRRSAELIVCRQAMGPSGTVLLDFQPSTGRFNNYSSEI